MVASSRAAGAAWVAAAFGLVIALATVVSCRVAGARVNGMVVCPVKMVLRVGIISLDQLPFAAYHVLYPTRVELVGAG